MDTYQWVYDDRAVDWSALSELYRIAPLLYANPGTEGFYAKLGFHRMNTAMAIWRDNESTIASGLLTAML